MIWKPEAVPPDEVTAEKLFHLFDQHHLVPENVDLAILQYRNMSETATMIEVVDTETKETVARVIFTDVIDGEFGTVDLIPTYRFFSPIGKDGQKNEDPVYEWAKEALLPIFQGVMERRDLRRITSLIPRTRNRTVKILRECGFRKEGVLRDGTKLKGKPVEDLILMGMTRE